MVDMPDVDNPEPVQMTAGQIHNFQESLENIYASANAMLPGPTRTIPAVGDNGLYKKHLVYYQTGCNRSYRKKPNLFKEKNRLAQPSNKMTLEMILPSVSG